MIKWNKADFMLFIAGIFFLLALALKISYPGSYEAKILLIVAEACLVGGIADWFATEALFRRPLGVSYHTALIPRNRDRLIKSLSRAVEHDFLSKEAIRERLVKTNLTDLAIDKIESSQALFIIRKIVAKLVNNVLLSLNPEKAGLRGEKIIKNLTKTAQAAPYLAKISKWALDTGKVTLLYNFIIGELTVFAAKPEMRDKIYSYLEKFKADSTANSGWFSKLVTWVMEQTDSLNLSDASKTLQDEILATLKKAGEPDSSIRKWFLEEFEKIITALPDNVVWIEAVEIWKNVFFTKLDLAGPISAAISSFKEKALDPDSGYQERIVDFLMAEVLKYWELFKGNDKMKEDAEEFLHYLADTLLDSKHQLLGVVVTKALDRLTDQDLVKFVEEKTSEDLVWIRINGVVVGGVVGLILGLFLHFVYDPYIMPLVKSFF